MNIQGEIVILKNSTTKYNEIRRAFRNSGKFYGIYRLIL